MKLSAKDLLKLKVIDEIIPEPLGGAHRDRDTMLENLKTSITQNLDYFKDLSPEEIANERKNKFLKIGRREGFISKPENLSMIDDKKNNINQLYYKNKKKLLFIFFLIILAAFLAIILL